MDLDAVASALGTKFEKFQAGQCQSVNSTEPNDQGGESDHWLPVQVSLIERQTNPLYAHKL